MNLNIDKMCRTCMSEGMEMVSLNENEIQRKLSECCNLQIQMSDDLPKNICKSCRNEIERVKLFRDKCLESDMQLRKLLNKPTPETVEVEIESNLTPEIDFSDAFDNSDGSVASDIDEVSYECKMCQSKFCSKGELKHHQCVSVHESDEFSCHMCDKTFVRKDRLSRHLKEHFTDTLESTDADDVMKSIPKKAKPTASGLFQCQICKILLKTRRNLVRHHKTHLGIKYKCKLCDKSYNRKYRVTEHMRDVHGIECTEDPEQVKGVPDKKCEVYTCEKCGKEFRNKYKLRDHLNVVHSDARPFLCGQCGQSFKTKAILQYHESRYHIQIRSFKCEQCPKAYYTNKELMAHIRSHTGERPFVCTDCGASYTHNDSLNTHRRIHTGERPYKCEFCPKSFTKGERLKIHRRVHTGERPYACCICNQRFTQKYDKVKHEKRHPEYQSEFIKE